MKKTKHSLWQPAAEQHYKKTYLVRKAQELEAEDEIKEYDGAISDYPIETSEVPYSQRVEAEGEM